MTKLCVVAAGGTGGHMFPAEALAREMAARGWRVVLATVTGANNTPTPFPPRSGWRWTPPPAPARWA